MAMFLLLIQMTMEVIAVMIIMTIAIPKKPLPWCPTH